MVVGIFVLLIFPIFIKIRVYADCINLELYFNILLFNVFKGLYGKVNLSKKNVNIWLKNKKTMCYPISIIFDIQKPFKPLNDYHLITFKSIVEVGVNTANCNVLMFTQAVNQAFGYVANYVSVSKPYVKLRNDIIIKEKNEKLQIYINTIFVFNFLIVLMSFIKILGEKIIYANRKK